MIKKLLLKNLKDLNSGISEAPEYEEYGFRSLVHGKPNIKFRRMKLIGVF